MLHDCYRKYGYCYKERGYSPSSSKQRKENCMTTKIKTLLCELKREYCKDYSIQRIDFENCLYRDFGNGYDVELSGFDNRSWKHMGIAYLWKDKSHTVKTVRDISPTAEAIHNVVENLRDEIESGLL